MLRRSGRGMAGETEVKVARLIKRSQNRRFYTRENYKQRIFVLARSHLLYFEIASGDNRGREKGRIALSLIHLVEYVDNGDLDNKENVFQICYTTDKTSSEKLFLYIVCPTAVEREEWVRAIRMLAKERGAQFQFHFHPGVWMRRLMQYSCCHDLNRRSNGCQRTTPPPSIVPPSATVHTSVGSAFDCSVNAAIQQQPHHQQHHQPLQQQHQQQQPLQQQQQQQQQQSGRRRSSTASSGATLDESPRESAPMRQRLDGVIVALRQQQQQQQQQPKKPAPPPLKKQQSLDGVVTAMPTHAVNNGSSALQTPTGNATVVFGGGPSGAGGAENITVTALHNYQPQRENQLALSRGERYFVLNSENPQWWYVRNVVGGVGYVPANHLQLPNGLNNFDWYYNDMTRQQAEAILLEENREGCFLVRDSLTKKNAFTLSVTSKDPENSNRLKVHHYHIHFDEATGVYFLSEKYRFPTVSDVIHYHRHNSGGLVVRLRFPPLKDKESSMIAGMGLDAFEIDPAELVIEREIGKGQFGLVLLGTFRTMQVAVKQMVEGAMNEADFIEEAKNMRFLNHPNLVLLFGVVLRSKPIMIITEYMRHGSLRDFLRSRHSSYAKRPVVLADISAQVAKGMAYLEQCKFVHRDLAARNCLVKAVNRRSVQVKVADFGMTRFLLDNVYEPSAGTKFPVRWAPPEVFQSSYTIKSDIWSFGVLMWEVFTCCQETPYHNMNNTQVYQFIVGGGRLTKPAVCPDRMYVLMLECWRYDPDGRPNFEYVCQCLSEYLDLNYEN